MISRRAPGTAACTSAWISSSVCTGLTFADQHRWGPDGRVGPRFEVMRPELGDWELAGGVGVEVPGAFWPSEFLLVDLFLERHEGVNERFRSGRAAWNVHIDGDITV